MAKFVIDAAMDAMLAYLADCDEIYGDHIERVVTWGGKAELSALVGTPIRLHVKMSDADLYAIRFR